MPKKKDPKEKVEKKGIGFKELIKALEKKYGEGLLTNASEIFDLPKVKTGNLLLDILLKGGIVEGSITTVYGVPSSCKSYTTYVLAKHFTSRKEKVAIIDTEKAFTKLWATKIGIDLKYVYLSQPDEFEKAIDIADACVESNEFKLVVVDSLTASIPKEEIDKSAYDQQMALQARLNSKLMKKITSRLQPKDLTDESTYNKTIFIGVAHIREKVGFFMGNPIILPGGWALKLHSHNILYFGTGKTIVKKGTEDPVGREIRIKVIKAKYSPPLVSGIIEFYFDPPKINNAKVLITYATQYGIIKRAGAWFTYKGIKECGAEKLLFKIKEEHPEYLDEIKRAVIEYDLPR